MPITKGHAELTSLADRERLAGPKRPDPWADGRSAKEAARAWLAGKGIELPPEIASTLDGHPALDTL